MKENSKKTATKEKETKGEKRKGKRSYSGNVRANYFVVLRYVLFW